LTTIVAIEYRSAMAAMTATPDAPPSPPKGNDMDDAKHQRNQHVLNVIALILLGGSLLAGVALTWNEPASEILPYLF
jgi:hypothetical protein